MLPCVVNGHKIGIAHARKILDEVDESTDVLDDVRFDPNVEIEKGEPTPSVLTLEPTRWKLDGQSDPLEYVKEWGREMQGETSSSTKLTPTDVNVPPLPTNEENVKSGEVERTCGLTIF
ncbi:hypothetical protein Dimus_033119 [Dionaea muscipula]